MNTSQGSWEAETKEVQTAYRRPAHRGSHLRPAETLKCSRSKLRPTANVKEHSGFQGLRMIRTDRSSLVLFHIDCMLK